jgi:hypothetical protein
MTLIPTIDDSMVVQLRRTGKRRASYRSSGNTRVFLQRSRQCKFFLQDCFGPHGEPGTCDAKLNCILDFNPGDDPFRLPRS